MTNMIKIKLEDLKKFSERLGIELRESKPNNFCISSSFDENKVTFCDFKLSDSVDVKLNRLKYFFKKNGYVVKSDFNNKRIYCIVNDNTIQSNCEFYADHNWITHPFFPEYKMCLGCDKDNYSSLSEEVKTKIKESMGRWSGYSW